MTEKQRDLKIRYMVPDLLDENFQPFRWKEVSLKEFKKELLKNGEFEYIESNVGFYKKNEIVLYVNYAKGSEKKIKNNITGKINWHGKTYFKILL